MLTSNGRSEKQDGAKPGWSKPLSAPVGQANLELVKWVAVAAMAIDHYGKIVDPGLLSETHAVGRVAFPLFATIIGVRLALQPCLAQTYLSRLLPWAIISQPVFILAGRPWHEGNILFTLFLGVMATMLLRYYASNRLAIAAAGILVLVPLASFVEYGILGVVMMPIAAQLAVRRISAALTASGPLGLAANVSPAWPPLQWIDGTALVASAISLTAARIRLPLPRLPTHVFYGFYPGHLLALHLIWRLGA